MTGIEAASSTINDDENDSCVQVAVRVRPMLPQEAGNTQCVEVLSSNSNDLNIIRLGGEQGPKFTFDEIFPTSTKQINVYTDRVLPLVRSCMEGYNATILAYGQTGSGKTHTIMGPSASLAASVQDEINAGVIPRAIQNMFSLLQQAKDKYNHKASEDNNSDDDDDEPQPFQFEVRVQFLEVYGEDIRDLLVAQQGSQKLIIRDVGLDEPEVVGASEQKVESSEEAILCLTRGMYRRVTGATAMNLSSSRSHAIFSLIVEQSTVVDDGNPAETNGPQHVQTTKSKFNFVDLAGSERQKRTKAEGLRLKEGIDINQGLLVLGNVISALGDPAKQGKAFVPYRDSKLTRLLKGSLGGNHKTLMIACVSPSSSNMEETLNCLRYANRAKNIQNHAVVNVDATSRLVSDLRRKMQMLAADLLKAKGGNLSDCTVPLEVIESIADGGDGENITALESTSLSPRRAPRSPRKATVAEKKLLELKAENEAYRIQLASLSTQEEEHSPGDLQNAFVARTVEYEREIARLKESLAYTPAESIASPQAPARSHHQQRLDSSPRERSDSPELRRLRAQVLGSMANPRNLDAEVEAEERAAKEVVTKFLKEGGDESLPATPKESIDEHAENNGGMSLQLEADLQELSNSISAKEELIDKLLVTQEKFEAMRLFYEGKLHEMEILLSKSEVETEKLSHELERLEKGHSGEEELKTKLQAKQDQVAQLRKKQAELSRLTSVATRNESQISKLRNEVNEMKHKKTDLQKQIMSERKHHSVEVQKLKKQTMQKERELYKVQRVSDKNAFEAERAKNMAKTRLEQLNQLKSKYRESEKSLRLQTLKRGVLSKAGFDPVMVGRRQSKNHLGKGSESLNVDSLRDFFDQKVADIGRKEALAEKLAQEWEEHLELSIRLEELQVMDESGEDLDTLNSQIKYKEDRIRQLASKLGKRENGSDNSSRRDETFLFDQKFQEIVGKSSSITSAKVATRVLFGMVVRERRRIASLARTASLLDERVQEAEATSMSKDEAFRAYMNEQRREAASLAQNQQDHILSLMEMVKEEPAAESKGIFKATSSGNSKLLVLANERIAVLERQHQELELECERLDSYRETEGETRSQLEEKTTECEELEGEIESLRSTLRRIRDDISSAQGNPENIAPENTSPPESSRQKSLLDAIREALELRESFPSTKTRKPSKRSKRSNAAELDRSFDLEYNSDDSDEFPDWADDIMNDLAIIAEGKMPSSLLESTDVLDAEARLEQNNVFDRLTNPSGFTGVQKQKKHIAARPPKPGQRDPDTPSSVDEKMSMSITTSESISKLVIPVESESPSSKRSVFDRLISPSNATGTQKNRMQDTQRGRTSRSSSIVEGHHDDASSGHQSYGESPRSNDSPGYGRSKRSELSKRLSKTAIQAQAIRQQLDAADQVLNTVVPQDPSTSAIETLPTNASSDRVQEYTKQNVFERLQKTTTQAYAVKRNVAMAEKLLDTVLVAQDESRGPPSELSSSSTTGSVGSTNERLDSKKAGLNHLSNKAPKTRRPGATIGSGRKSPTEYNSVFERLHKTTTEAKAKKSSRSSRTVAST